MIGDYTMKKILKGIIALLFIFILSACCKDYKSITYTKFIESFKEESGYLVSNETSLLSDKFERYIEASGKNNQFIYYEFKTEEDARNYVSINYKDRKYFSYKDKKNYMTVKSTKSGYFYLVQVDNTIIIGNTDIKSNKREIKRILKKLGY